MNSSYDRFKDPRHIEWSKSVKERDNYTCNACSQVGGSLHSHHQDSWDFYVEKRFNINNGITLCSMCHMKFHDIYGHSRNSKYQFKEFIKTR